MAPTVLIVTTLRWPFAARLAMALARSSCRVQAYCPSGHPLHCVKAVEALHAHSEFSPLRALRRAIERARPALVLPCDDRAAADLLELHRAGHHQNLIEHSLGLPEACDLASTRAEVMTIARGCRVQAARTVQITSERELRAEWTRRPQPPVIKLDNTWGGEGVWMPQEEEEAVRIFHAAGAGVPLHKALSQWWIHGDGGLWRRWRQKRRPCVSLQDRASGRPANRAVACWRGEVLAGISVEVLQSRGTRGPASVVRVIQHGQMEQAAARVVRRLGVSGLWGFDFMLDPDSGQAELIEINPRATPVAQLAQQGRSPLVEALVQAALGVPAAAATTLAAGQVVAMFPDEWLRDRASPHLGDGAFDVPWDEPELVRECLRPPQSARGLWVSLRRWRRQAASAGVPALPASGFSERLQPMAERIEFGGAVAANRVVHAQAPGLRDAA